MSVPDATSRCTGTRRGPTGPRPAGPEYVCAPMMLYLVRHAKAGSRSSYEGPDRLRPLTKAGRRQAEAIADRLADAGVPRVLSSPYVRCVQTVEPLADRLRLPVEPTAALAEGSPFGPVLDLLADAADGTVLCTHGDVLPDVLDALARRGAVLAGPGILSKGVTWVLERHDGTIRSAHALPPPP
jgi:8-oxo-dGTP diphosphatase